MAGGVLMGQSLQSWLSATRYVCYRARADLTGPVTASRHACSIILLLIFLLLLLLFLILIFLLILLCVETG
jgi:hypothetical protein